MFSVEALSNLLQQWADTFSAIGSVIVSLALLYVYRNQNDILDEQSTIQAQQVDFQEQQTEIMEQQQKLMKANHLPAIHIDEVDVIDKENDFFLITLSNFGTGIAKNLRVVSEPEWSNETYNSRDRSNHLIRHADESAANGVGNIMEPDEREATFRTRIGVCLYGDHPEVRPFSDAMDELRKTGSEEVQLTLRLAYEDIVDETHDNLEIKARRFELRESLDLTDAMNIPPQTDAFIRTEGKMS